MHFDCTIYGFRPLHFYDRNWCFCGYFSDSFAHILLNQYKQLCENIRFLHFFKADASKILKWVVWLRAKTD
jgi:hypothetical protein